MNSESEKEMPIRVGSIGVGRGANSSMLMALELAASSMTAVEPAVKEATYDIPKASPFAGLRKVPRKNTGERKRYSIRIKTFNTAVRDYAVSTTRLATLNEQIPDAVGEERRILIKKHKRYFKLYKTSVEILNLDLSPSLMVTYDVED